MGIKILHKLCKMLNEYGYEAYVNCERPMKGIKTIWGQEAKLRTLLLSGAMAIYPEIVGKNVLWSKNPIGWMLNSGKFAFEREGLIFTYNKIYGDYETFTLLDIEPYFNNDKKYNRNINLCTNTGKGYPDQRFELVENKTWITLRYPKNRKQMADLMKHANCLYTFDARTAMHLEARLCGCPVVLFENSFNTLDEIKKGGFTTLGITNDITKIEQARSELKYFKVEFDKIVNNNIPELIKFIKISQEWAMGRMANG
jgi:hypothetical protein